MNGLNRPLLLVEDEPDDITFVKRALAKHHIVNDQVVVHTLADAQRWLTDRAATDRLPVVMILDLYLPDGSGLTLLEWVRAQPEPLGALPVIVLTVATDWTTEERVAALRAVAYLRKPATEAMLPDVLTTVGLAITHRTPANDDQLIAG
jgi:CheY-like chemotaxis protein